MTDSSQQRLSRSPYLFISDDVFARPDGRQVVPAFRADDATPLLLPRRVSDALAAQTPLTSVFTPKELSSLVESGLIVADPTGLRREVYSRMAAADADGSHRIFVLLPSSYCNMGCTYCGQEHVRGAGLGGNHRVAVAARVCEAIRDPAVKKVAVRWFGGEPLMGFATMRQLSREFVPLADSCGVDYESNIVTNGALLDERKLRVLRDECRITTLHITIDGPEEVHDSHRPLKSGGRSFSRLVSFLAAAVGRPENSAVTFVLRTNIDVRNSDYVGDYLREMAGRGFARRKNVLFSLIPVHPWSNDVSQLEMDKAVYAAAEARWLRLMDELKLNTVMVPTSIKTSPCGAVSTSGEVISATGGMFGCTEQPLVPEHETHSVLCSVDDLAASARRPRGQFDGWSTTVAKGLVPCASCWMLPVCGGHCPKAWADGDVPCPSMKFNMADRLDIIARRRGLRRVGSRSRQPGAIDHVEPGCPPSAASGATV